MIYKEKHMVLHCLRSIIRGVVMVLFSGALWANEYTSPAAIDGSVTIDAEQLVELVGSRPDIVLIDSRIQEDHTEGYIEGSVNLVDRDTRCDTLAVLLAGKAAPLVFYCNGINCDRSDKAIVIAVACGYQEIYWFRGGVEEWRLKNYPLVQSLLSYE